MALPPHPLLGAVLARDASATVERKYLVAGDTLPQRKPDPAPLLHACKIMNVAPNEMLMIGDSLNDTQAARAAGCPVFCVGYGYNEGHDVHDLDVDAIVATLVEANSLISK